MTSATVQSGTVHSIATSIGRSMYDCRSIYRIDSRRFLPLVRLAVSILTITQLNMDEIVKTDQKAHLRNIENVMTHSMT